MNAAETIAQNYPPQYRISDWPFSFYFNGETLPKWSASWPHDFLENHLREDDYPSRELGERDVYVIKRKIDTVAGVESAPPAIFLFALQRALLLLLEHPEEASAAILDFHGPPDANEVMKGLFEGGMQMRELVLRDRFAVWTSGYETDRERLAKAVEQLRIVPVPLYLPPHQQSVSMSVTWMIGEQVKHFHRLAQSGQSDKALRTRLNQITLPDESFFKLVT